MYVHGLIDSAKREFARGLPGQPANIIPPSELLDQVESLQRENLALKAEIATLRDRAAATLPRPAPGGTAEVIPLPAGLTPLTVAPLSQEAPPAEARAPSAATAQRTPPAGRTHTVAKGDTLYSLAQHYYGNRSRWRDLQSANRDQLGGSSALRVGMVLKIP